MKLYYHKTDGGAEYYCLKPVDGTDEGDIRTTILRTDGGELELFDDNITSAGIRVVRTKPFWALEYDYTKARQHLEGECFQAQTLQDAILCGANMTYLDGEQVGYVGEDGTFEKYGEWLDGSKSELCLSDIEVEFDRLDRDEDGYTIAHFVSKEEK